MRAKTLRVISYVSNAFSSLEVLYKIDYCNAYTILHIVKYDMLIT